MVRGDAVRSQAFRQGVRDAFGEPPRVDEEQGCPVSADQFGDAVIQFGPHFMRGDGAEFVAGNQHGQVHVAAMAGVDDARAGADEVRDLFDRLDRGGQADALRA